MQVRVHHNELDLHVGRMREETRRSAARSPGGQVIRSRPKPMFGGGTSGSWQGPDRGSAWTGQSRSSGEMIPVWTGFSRWAAAQAPEPSREASGRSPEL